MKSKLFWFGAVASAAYISIMFWFFGWRFHRLLGQDLNEVGDFLAGAFSPLAFLWLVLGFMQQGQELKVSSDALVEQAKELKKSVEQQAIIASTAVKQIEAQALAYELQMEDREKEMSALFSFEFIESYRKPGGKTAYLKVTNHGGWANHVSLRFEPVIGEVLKYGFPSFKPEQSREVTFDLGNTPHGQKTGSCIVEYVGLDKKWRSAVFSYTAIPEQAWIFVKTPEPDGQG